MIILPANTLATGEFEVANSCRFNKADNPELSRSTGDGNERIGNFSFWWKPAADDSGCVFYSVYVDSNNFFDISCDGSMNLQVRNKLSGSYNMDIKTNRVFRDPLAWYSIIVLIDTTQSTEANRVKIYINGTQETSLATSSYPSQNTDMIMNSNSRTARISSSQDRMHGYLAEFVAIDGTAKVVGDFGEFGDEDSPNIWMPKDVSGLSGDKGVNGFYMDWEDSSSMGNCAFGGTDFTVSNLAATDQATDTPTNNFCTMNPLDNYRFASTFSQGNNTVATGASTQHFNIATMGVSTGKWCWEVYIRSLAGAGYFQIGIVGDNVAGGSSSYTIGDSAYQYGWKQDTGAVRNNSSNGSYGSAYQSTGIIIGVYLDLDNNKLYFTKDGTIENSGTGVSITAASSTPNGVYLPAIGDNSSNSGTVDFNFGATPFADTAISSGNTDGTYGNFEYSTTITGDGSSKVFKALCTKNLAEYG